MSNLTHSSGSVWIATWFLSLGPGSTLIQSLSVRCTKAVRQAISSCDVTISINDTKTPEIWTLTASIIPGSRSSSERDSASANEDDCDFEGSFEVSLSSKELRDVRGEDNPDKSPAGALLSCQRKHNQKTGAQGFITGVRTVGDGRVQVCPRNRGQSHAPELYIVCHLYALHQHSSSLTCLQYYLQV